VTHMKVVVVGLGYVGAVTAACLAAGGHDVWGVDIDQAKVDDLGAGRSPVAEPGLDALVARAVADGRLHATSSCEQALDRAEMSLVCVGTPATQRGATDLSFLRRAVTEIARALSAVDRAPGGHSVVIRSTVPPGTTDQVVAPALARIAGQADQPGHAASKASHNAGETSHTIGETSRDAGEARRAVGVAMCPEFLREGCGIADFHEPPLLVAGTADARAADAVRRLFAFLGQPVQVVDTRVAEALKYTCNAFHATKVAFANEVGRLCRPFGVDSRQLMTLFCQDQVLNISPSYLRPGFAFGGSCLPKDLRSLLHLARVHDADLPLLAATLATNELSVADVIDRVIASGARVVAMFGLSFKMNTDDLRDSPNVEVAERLIGKGFEVRIFDHEVNPARLVGANRRYVESKLPHLSRLLAREPAEALFGADIAIVSAGSPLVRDALLAAPPPRLIDLSGQLGTELEALPGYEGIGW
jgi:UDP-glucose 6-dehydrogenase